MQQQNIKSFESNGVNHIFKSMSHAGKYYGISAGSVYHVLYNVRPTTKTRYGNVNFSFTNEESDVIYIDRRTLVKQRKRKRTPEEKKLIQKICHHNWAKCQQEIKKIMNINYL